MKLYLMRHGEAEDGVRDAERRLTEHGSEVSRKMVMALKHAGLGRQLRVVSSKFTRARQTADIVRAGLGTIFPEQTWDGVTPYDPVEPIAAQMQLLEEDLMLVGHNPVLSLLTARLLTGSGHGMYISFKKSACVCLERMDPYHKDKGGISSWSLRWYLTPGLLG